MLGHCDLQSAELRIDLKCPQSPGLGGLSERVSAGVLRGIPNTCLASAGPWTAASCWQGLINGDSAR